MEEKESKVGFNDSLTVDEQMKIVKEKAMKAREKDGTPKKTWEETCDELLAEIEKFSKENDSTTL